MVADGSGRAVALTRAPCPSCQSPRPLFSTSTADDPHVAKRWLTFYHILVLALSGGPDLVIPQRDADTLSRWPISRPISTFWGIYRIVVTAAASRMQYLCNCSPSSSDDRLELRILMFADMLVLHASMRMTLPFLGLLLTASCWRICPVLGRP